MARHTQNFITKTQLEALYIHMRVRQRVCLTFSTLSLLPSPASLFLLFLSPLLPSPVSPSERVRIPTSESSESDTAQSLQRGRAHRPAGSSASETHSRKSCNGTTTYTLCCVPMILNEGIIILTPASERHLCTA